MFLFLPVLCTVTSPLSFYFCHVHSLIGSFIFALQLLLSFYLFSHSFDLISCLITTAFLEAHLVMSPASRLLYVEQTVVSFMTMGFTKHMNF